MLSDDLQRFLVKVTVESNDCWVFHGYRNKNGYGRFRYHGTVGYAHRFAYEAYVGPIPSGLTIDHLCRNRACVNPKHLEVVTQGENTKRGDAISVRHARRTHCSHGHEFTTENTMRRYDGTGRRCRICRNRQRRERRARRTAEKNGHPLIGHSRLF